MRDIRIVYAILALGAMPFVGSGHARAGLSREMWIQISAIYAANLQTGTECQAYAKRAESILREPRLDSEELQAKLKALWQEAKPCLARPRPVSGEAAPTPSAGTDGGTRAATASLGPGHGVLKSEPALPAAPLPPWRPLAAENDVAPRDPGLDAPARTGSAAPGTAHDKPVTPPPPPATTATRAEAPGAAPAAPRGQRGARIPPPKVVDLHKDVRAALERSLANQVHAQTAAADAPAAPRWGWWHAVLTALALAVLVGVALFGAWYVKRLRAAAGPDAAAAEGNAAAPLGRAHAANHVADTAFATGPAAD